MLDSLHIKNFRCFEDLTIPSLGRVNLIVGKNNSGKSTLLEAMNIYAHSKYSEQNTIQEIITTLVLRHELYVGSSSSSRHEQFKTIFHHSTSATEKAYIGQPQKTFVELEIEKTDDAIGFRLKTDDNVNSKFFQIGKIITNPIEDYFKSYSEYLDNKKFNFLSCILKSLKTKKVRLQNQNRFYLTTKIIPEDELALLYDKIREETKKEDIIKKLAILDKDISDIYAKDRGDGERIFMMETMRNNKSIPLKSAGEGMSRLLQIFLYAFQARGGYLMIDEFENGLHYSIQEEVWEKLFNLAKELDIQLFATTHSQDTIKAFSKIALQSEEEGRLISLGRNEREIDKGKITALTYNEDDIKLIAETGMEVR